MEKQKLIITKGLPASGKSTWAKEQVSENTVRVNKDDLRAMINNGKWSKEREAHIAWLQDKIIHHYLEEGKTVIVDNTHLAPKWEPHMKAIAEIHDVAFRVKDFTHVPLSECLERNENREAKVPRKTIMDMYHRHVRKAPVYPESGYILCDIDGTLAHMEGRSPYDGSKVHEDKVDLPVKTILSSMKAAGYVVVIVTARDGEYLDVTEKWLEDNDVEYDSIFIRKAKDNREDSIVKQEMYENEIKPLFGKPLFVIDDRKRVVDMWRSLGLKCLQVEPGNFK